MLIMLADDDIDDSDLFREAVEEVHPKAEVIVSRNGRQLLSQLDNKKPALIFVDINMPEMNGWQCLKVLKNDPALNHIPVIMYTTSSSKLDAATARDLGASHLITKPDRYQDLVKVLGPILNDGK